MTGEPLGEFVLVFDLDQVHGVLLVDLGQGPGARGGGRIGGVDPIDEGLFVPKDQGCSIEHDRCTWIILGTSTAASLCRAGMVLVDQPTEDPPTFDHKMRHRVVILTIVAFASAACDGPARAPSMGASATKPAPKASTSGSIVVTRLHRSIERMGHSNGRGVPQRKSCGGPRRPWLDVHPGAHRLSRIADREGNSF